MSFNSYRSFRLPDVFQHRRRGSSVPAVLTLLPGLADDDTVVEGYVLSGKSKYAHTWLEVNGIFYDPTMQQFARLACWKEPTIFYQLTRRLTVAEYKQMVNSLLPWWDERIRSFGGSTP